MRLWVPQGVGKKLNTPLIFAPHLDMRPYLSSTVLRKRFTAKHTPSAGGPKSGGGSPQDGNGIMYELYAVVCHRGNLQARIAGLAFILFQSDITAKGSAVSICTLSGLCSLVSTVHMCIVTLMIHVSVSPMKTQRQDA